MGDDRRRGETERLQDGRLRVRHVGAILEDDGSAVVVGDAPDLLLDLGHCLGIVAQLADGPHEQVADRRVAAEEILELVEHVVPVELHLDSALLELAEQGVGEVADAVLVERLPVLVDDVAQDELADLGAPARELLHVAAVHGQEPRQEVDRVALVDVPEDLVEQADDGHERGVVVAEARAAHVVREDVGAHGEQRRLQVDAARGGARSGDFGFELVHHEGALRSEHLAQSVELERRGSRVAIVARQRAPGFLQVRPVAKRQS